MDYLISVSFGELTLKGDNRKDFENRIIRKIKKAIADFEVEEFYKEQGKVYIKADRELFDEMIEQIKKVFGIFYICEVLRTTPPSSLESSGDFGVNFLSTLFTNTLKVFSSFIPKSLTKTLVASFIFSSFFSVLKTSQI